MNRDDAAALLGIPADAGPDIVRRSWRLWARVAHPDAGGDPEYFAQLDLARRVMLTPVLPAGTQSVARSRLQQVLRPPAHLRLLIAGAFMAIATAVLPAVLLGQPAPHPSMTLVLAAAPAALAATTWAVWATKELLNPGSDRGHRITMLALAWIPLASGQLLVSIIAGASLLPVLPVLALPIVAAVAALDPGSGLSR